MFVVVEKASKGLEAAHHDAFVQNRMGWGKCEMSSVLSLSMLHLHPTTARKLEEEKTYEKKKYMFGVVVCKNCNVYPPRHYLEQRHWEMSFPQRNISHRSQSVCVPHAAQRIMLAVG